MFMKCVKVNLGEFAEIEDSHTAADVNAHYIGNDLVAKVAGETNDAACPGVNVRHNAYLLVGKHINRKEFLDLVQGVLLDVVRKYLYVIFFYYPHILMFSILNAKLEYRCATILRIKKETRHSSMSAKLHPR